MEKDDPYLTKAQDLEADEYEVEERGEDGGGKYIKYKSKKKDEQGESKHKYKVYTSEFKDSGLPE